MTARSLSIVLTLLSCEGSSSEPPAQRTPVAPRESAQQQPTPTPPRESAGREPAPRSTVWLDAEPVPTPSIGPKDSLERRGGECRFAPALSCPPGSACNVPVPEVVDCRTPPPPGKAGWFRFPARVEQESSKLCRYQSQTWCPPPPRGGDCTPTFRVRVPCAQEARFRWSGSCFRLDAVSCAQPPCEERVPQKIECEG